MIPLRDHIPNRPLFVGPLILLGGVTIKHFFAGIVAKKKCYADTSCPLRFRFCHHKFKQRKS